MATKTLVGIQEEYIKTVNAGMARWAHRKDGGHSSRINRGARRKMELALAGLGFSVPQILAAVRDAWDVAALIRRSETE